MAQLLKQGLVLSKHERGTKEHVCKVGRVLASSWGYHVQEARWASAGVPEHCEAALEAQPGPKEGNHSDLGGLRYSGIGHSVSCKVRSGVGAQELAISASVSEANLKKAGLTRMHHLDKPTANLEVRTAQFLDAHCHLCLSLQSGAKRGQSAFLQGWQKRLYSTTSQQRPTDHEGHGSSNKKVLTGLLTWFGLKLNVSLSVYCGPAQFKCLPLCPS
jgi:hypothetical protein